MSLSDPSATAPAVISPLASTATPLLPGADGRVIVAQRLRPFAVERRVLELPAGLTLAEMVELAEPDPIMRQIVVARIGDWIIPPDRWHRVRPRPGAHVRLVPVPQGGGNMLNTVLTIAVVATAMAAMPFLAPTLGVFGAGLVATSISVGGMLAVNAIAPPAQPQLEQGRVKDSPTYSLEGGSNQARPWQAIPRLYGHHRMYPDLAAPWITENDGDDVYLCGLLCWGYGPISIDQLRLGDTPLDSFQGVEVQHAVGVPGELASFSIYPSTITPLQVQAILTQADGFVSRTTSPDSDAATLDLQMPKGGIKYGKKTGDRIGIDVDFEIQYKATTSSFWNTAPAFRIAAKTTSVVRRSVTVTFPSRDQYDVRIRRLTGDSSDEQTFNETWWAQLKSRQNENPVRKTGLALTALRIKASEQLSGTIDDLNGLAASVLPSWNGEARQWFDSETQNPADHFRAILQFSGQKKPVPDEQVDFAAIEDWAEWAWENGFRCNFIFDKRISTWEALRLVAAAGRAAPTAATGRWAPIIDRPRPYPIQLFTPRNLKSFSGRRIWVDYPHALRISFVDETSNFVQKTRDVYADGYDESNAEKFEDHEIPGVTDPELIWRFGRFRLAEARLRPENYTGETDFEHLVCTRGDLVRISHDSALWGSGWGRIRAISLNEAGTHIETIELDEKLALQPGAAYAVRIRGLDGQSIHNITNAGISNTVRFITPVALVSALFAVGDLVTVGERTRETFEVLVQAITPGADLSARISFIPYSPAIFTADTEVIPDWDPGLTLPPGALVPIITSVRSGEQVGKRMADGSVLVLVLVSLFDDGSRPLTTISGVELRWREVDSGSPWRYVNAPPEAREVVISEAEVGQVIEIAVRYRFTSGKAGRWSAAEEHTVEGPSIPPPDVESIYIDGLDIAWSYPFPPADHAGFRLRYAVEVGAPWAEAISLTDGLITTNAFAGAALPQGVQEVMVKAETTAGLQSINEARLEVTAGTLFERVRIATTDFAAQNWPGTLIGGERVDGKLRSLDTSLWLAPATNSWLAPHEAIWLDPSWADLEWRGKWTAPMELISTDRIGVLYHGEGRLEVYYRKVFGELTMVADTAPIPDNLLVQQDELPLGAFFEGDSIHPWIPWRQGVQAAPGDSLEILVRARAQTVIRTVTPAASGAFLADVFEAGVFLGTTSTSTPTETGVAVLASDVFEAAVFSTGGSGNTIEVEAPAIVDQFKIIADAMEIEEVIGSYVIPAGGGKLPIARSYRGIRYVLHTLHGGLDGTTAVVIKVVSFAADGPLVVAETADGGSVSAVATFRIGGW